MPDISMTFEDTGRFARTYALDDGRVLGYADAGRASGRPLVFFHGTPSSRLDAAWLDEPAANAGWRLIAVDRPGIGLSSPRQGGSVRDHALDVMQLLDGLGIERATTLGYSGGAPYALAAAREAPDRVDLVGLVSGWGPPDRSDAYLDVATIERLSDAIARHAPLLTRAMFAAVSSSLRLAPTTSVRLLARRFEGEVPALQPTPEALGPVLEAFRQGSAGAARDLHLIVCPWGFDLDEITVPVRLWHGDRDREIPLHHSEYVAGAVLDGHLEVLGGGDHLALYRHTGDILTSLASVAAG
ncbi:MAG TPA: alpha/beta hydrolase [Acidimicrobiales bacterium]|nr:alpha/beta hydrolase [Acidimicrobiales bacterium]